MAAIPSAVNRRGSARIAPTLSQSQNTKLKLVKRQMYGRAKLDLLRARLLGAP